MFCEACHTLVSLSWLSYAFLKSARIIWPQMHSLTVTVRWHHFRSRHFLKFSLEGECLKRALWKWHFRTSAQFQSNGLIRNDGTGFWGKLAWTGDSKWNGWGGQCPPLCMWTKCRCKIFNFGAILTCIINGVHVFVFEKKILIQQHKIKSTLK